MTKMSAYRIADLIYSHKRMSFSQMYDAIAIALAESGGNTLAISSSHDYGLWQINRIHFGDGIINSHNWQDPDVQFREMWRLSSGMTNWAAWCTAWKHPQGNCGHGHLSHVQIGSIAITVKPYLISITGGWVPKVSRKANPPGQSPAAQAAKSTQAAWSYIRNYYSKVAPVELKAIQAGVRAIQEAHR